MTINTSNEPRPSPNTDYCVYDRSMPFILYFWVLMFIILYHENIVEKVKYIPRTPNFPVLLQAKKVARVYILPFLQCFMI